MESFWGTFRHWRQDGHSHQSHPHVVYVHFTTYPGFPNCNLYDSCFLDEYETLYESQEEKPDLEPLREFRSWDFGCRRNFHDITVTLSH